VTPVFGGFLHDVPPVLLNRRLIAEEHRRRLRDRVAQQFVARDLGAIATRVPSSRSLSR